MRARTRTANQENCVLLDDPDAAQRYQISISLLRKISEEQGAVVRVGRLRRNRVSVLDSYFGIEPQAE